MYLFLIVAWLCTFYIQLKWKLERREIHVIYINKQFGFNIKVLQHKSTILTFNNI